VDGARRRLGPHAAAAWLGALHASSSASQSSASGAARTEQTDRARQATMNELCRAPHHHAHRLHACSLLVAWQVQEQDEEALLMVDELLLTAARTWGWPHGRHLIICSILSCSYPPVPHAQRR
jgi:hypothetical protein